MDIHRSYIRDFVLPKVKSVFVVDYYQVIKSMLDSRDDFQYNDVFANPRIRTQNEIVWSTDSFVSKPVLLSNLQVKEKLFYSDVLRDVLYSLEQLVVDLGTEETNTPLRELMSKAIAYIDDGSVYCADGRIVIVNWGILPRRADLQYSTIYKSGHFIGAWENYNSRTKYNNVADSDIPVNKINDEEFMAESPETPEIEPEVTDVHDDVAVEDLESEDNVQTQEEIIDEHDDSDEQTDSEEVLLEDESNAESSVSEDLPDSKKKFRYWKWLLSLFLLLWIVMFLCKDLKWGINIINPFYNPLPSAPVVKPIYDGMTGESADGMSIIATDRLNIILTQDKGVKTMLKWARAFKRHYPGKKYEITYYDKELDFIQIMVPSAERELIKSKLQSQLPEFSFDVFDESVNVGSTLNDPFLTDLSSSWYLYPIDAFGAWDITKGIEDVIIAVVDTGFDMSHPEFEGRIYSVHNALDNNEHVYPIKTKDGLCSHGTHVAATAAGNCNNGEGLLGIAPQCRLMLVQAAADSESGCLSSTAIREGAMYAIRNGADVVNISAGYAKSDYEKGLSESQQLNYINNTYKFEETLWKKIADMAEERKCVLVFSAGNDDLISGMDPMKRIDGTIRVSAVDKHMSKASFSNYGVYPHLRKNYSTVSAPGVDICSAVVNAGYDSYQGTSMAAPIVAGAVALMKSIDRNLTSFQIIDILKRTGYDVGDDIGPMINIGKALQELKGDGEKGRLDCKKISKEIRELRHRLDSLIRLCPDAAEPEDTLKFKNVVKDPLALNGLWKATTELVATSDNSPVELYMEFSNLDGILTWINKGENFEAPLKVEIDEEKIHLTQLSKAMSETNHSFAKYDFYCSADRKGNLLCSGISELGTRINFNLVRVKY